jgi:hypothetical protein
MTRMLALLIATLPLALTARADSQHPEPGRFSLLRIEAVPAASRYRVLSDTATADARGRYRLLGAERTKASTEACTPGDGIFSNGFED